MYITIHHRQMQNNIEEMKDYWDELNRIYFELWAKMREYDLDEILRQDHIHWNYE